MKTVILAGGLGTRLSEETVIKPKPMVEVGGFPILWHIMKIYDFHGFKDFIIPLGYKGEVIQKYFLMYHPVSNDISIDLSTGQVNYHHQDRENWHIRLIETGINTLTGGRLLRLHNYLKNEETFMLTYGDGVADVNIRDLLDFHKQHKKIATLTAVRPPARFGSMQFNGNQIVSFEEKPQTGEGWINGGFFVFNREIFQYLEDDNTILERSPLEGLAKAGELMAYHHEGFWQCMELLACT